MILTAFLIIIGLLLYGLQYIISIIAREIQYIIDTNAFNKSFNSLLWNRNPNRSTLSNLAQRCAEENIWINKEHTMAKEISHRCGINHTKCPERCSIQESDSGCRKHTDRRECQRSMKQRSHASSHSRRQQKLHPHYW